MNAGNITVTGDGSLTVKADGTSIANATVNRATASVGLLSVGVNVMKAYANGNYAAYLDKRFLIRIQKKKNNNDVKEKDVQIFVLPSFFAKKTIIFEGNADLQSICIL